VQTWHPAVIHFPLVLGLLWPWLDLFGLIWRRPDLHKVALGILIAALVSSMPAVITGQTALDRAVAAQVPIEVLLGHTDDANLVPWLFVALLIIRVVLPMKLARAGQIVALVCGFASGAFLFGVGKSGGELVFGHGIGVQPLKQTSRSAN
jgi:uncharacterized membrane protein